MFLIYIDNHDIQQIIIFICHFFIYYEFFE